MIRSPLPLLALATLLATAACDRTQSLTITPELDEETSFEQGLDGWAVDRTTTSTGSGQIVSGGASEGSSYLRIDLGGGSDLVWIERSFTLTPGTPYSVTVSADLRAITGDADVRVFAGPGDPNGSGFVSEGPAPGQWTRTLSPRPVTADGAGRIWVAIGFAGTGQAGQFGIDRLSATFLRTGGS